MTDEVLDAAHDGHVAVFTELLKDEKFRTLVGHLANMYAVTARKVTSIDQRSFRVSKEEVTKFVARTSGWNAKLSRETRNGSWRRGAIHEGPKEQGWAGNVEHVGRRSGRLESTGVETVPAGDKTRCPNCRKAATKVMAIRGRLCCPGCVKRVASATGTERHLKPAGGGGGTISLSKEKGCETCE